MVGGRAVATDATTCGLGTDAFYPAVDVANGHSLRNNGRGSRARIRGCCRQSVQHSIAEHVQYRCSEVSLTFRDGVVRSVRWETSA